MNSIAKSVVFSDENMEIDGKSINTYTNWTNCKVIIHGKHGSGKHRSVECIVSSMQERNQLANLIILSPDNSERFIGKTTSGIQYTSYDDVTLNNILGVCRAQPSTLIIYNIDLIGKNRGFKFINELLKIKNLTLFLICQHSLGLSKIISQFNFAIVFRDDILSNLKKLHLLLDPDCSFNEFKSCLNSSEHNGLIFRLGMERSRYLLEQQTKNIGKNPMAKPEFALSDFSSVQFRPHESVGFFDKVINIPTIELVVSSMCRASRIKLSDVIIVNKLGENIYPNLLTQTQVYLPSQMNQVYDFCMANPGKLILFDRCINELLKSNDEQILEILFNGRHMKISYLIFDTSIIGFTQELRKNFNKVIFGYWANFSTQQKIYDSYCGMYPTFKAFTEYYEKISTQGVTSYLLCECQNNSRTAKYLTHSMGQLLSSSSEQGQGLNSELESDQDEELEHDSCPQITVLEKYPIKITYHPSSDPIEVLSERIDNIETKLDKLISLLSKTQDCTDIFEPNF